jgi:hypothetical protein
MNLFKNDFICFILGVLPNYLAPLSLTFCIFYVCSYNSNKKNITKRNDLIFYGSLLFSSAGLIWWEFSQNEGLVFDKNDIYATLMGGFTSLIIYYFIRKNINNFQKKTII